MFWIRYGQLTLPSNFSRADSFVDDGELFLGVLQGDTSHCSLGSVDMKMKGALWYKEHYTEKQLMTQCQWNKGNNMMSRPEQGVPSPSGSGLG